MFGLPARIKKISLYLMDSEAQLAAMILAQQSAMHPLENSRDDIQLNDFPVRPYHDIYQRLQSRFQKLSRYIQYDFDELPADQQMDIITLEELQDSEIKIRELWKSVSDIEEQLRHQKDQLHSLRQLLASLNKFSTLKIDLAKLRRQGHFLDVRVGTIPENHFAQLQRALSLANFVIQPFYQSADTRHIIVAGPLEMQQDAEHLLKSSDFRETPIPEEFTGNPAELKNRLNEQEEEINSRIQIMEARLTDRIHEHRKLLETTHKQLLLAQPFASLNNVMRSKGGLFFLQGWVPASREWKFREQLELRLHSPYHVEFTDPDQQELSEVPTVLNNSWLLAPFQKLVNNFGIPSYTEIDPTVLFGLSYILMFGMMFGDIGHGAVIAIAGLFVMHRYPVISTAAVLTGLSSMSFGFLYGSLFGYEHVIAPLWMSPMHDPMLMLIVAVTWGVFFLLVASLLSIRNLWVLGKYHEAIYSSKGIAGMLFYLALIYMIYQLFNNQSGWLELLFLLVPFAFLQWFHWQHSQGALWERMLVVSIEGLEHIISTVSSTLSFLRVAAFSLNHVALAAAVFSIAAMMGTAGHWLTVLLGNVFIIVLEGAIVAIQCLRLEYFEGFSRFFIGKGKVFQALKLEHR